MIIKVKVTANAKCNQIIGFQNNILKIKIKDVAQKGKANRALIKFLAKILSVAPSNIAIIAGQTHTIKKIQINNIEEKEALKILKAQSQITQLELF